MASSAWTPVNESTVTSSAAGWTPVQENTPSTAAANVAKVPVRLGGGSTYDQFKEAAKGNDVDVPLTGYGAATKQGLLNSVQGISQGVQGVGHAVAHPIDTLANIGDVATLGLTHLIPGADKAAGGDTVSGAADLPSQAAELVRNPPTLSEVGKAAGNSGGQILGSVAAGKVAEGVVKAPFQAGRILNTVKNLANVPKAVDAEATGHLANVADREGLPPLQSESIRPATEELQKSFIKRAQDQYAIVDKAVGGDLKPVQEKIAQLKKAIRINANVNPDLADAQIDQLALQQKTLSNLIQKAKAAGVANAEDLMNAGDKDYAKGMAMKKVVSAVKTSAGEAKSGGLPDPSKFAGQVDRLNNLGILDRALGPEGKQAFIDTARRGMKLSRTSTAVKTAAAGTVAVGAGYAAKNAVVNAIKKTGDSQ